MNGNTGLELADLGTFVAIADAGGVTAAARRLGLPKSIVSRRLSRLEKSLGTTLMTRTTRGAALTEAGATFREHAARVQSEIEAAWASIAPEGELRGQLRVSAPLSFGLTHVAPMLAELARRHPRLQVHAGYSDRYVDLIAEGYDCAIRIGYLADSSLVARRIRPMRGRIVASPAYLATRGAPKSLDDLANHEVVSQISETWRIQDGDSVRLVHPPARFRADNGQSLVPALLGGLGIGMLPDFLGDEHLASGRLVRVLEHLVLAEAAIWFVRPPGGQAPRSVRALLELLLEHCGSATPP